MRFKLEYLPSSDLFRTREFLDSDWIQALCRRIGRVWTTTTEMPPGHFGTYFGAMQRRTYANPWIADLYALHECTHVDTLTYDPLRPWSAWSKAMIRSEMEASLTSECFAYLEIPGLREKTFRHEIWVDRFLRMDPDGDGITTLVDHIRKERIRALNAPAFDDFLEFQIHNYSRQNMKWCALWSEAVGGNTRFQGEIAFRLVEAHMASPDRDATHREWIESLTEKDGLYAAPFLRQANAFNAVYQASNAQFGNWVFDR